MPGDHKVTKWNYLKATAEVPTALNLHRKKGNNMPATDRAISISKTKHSVNKMPGCLGDVGQQIHIFMAGRMKAETSTATLSRGRLKRREAHLFSVYVTRCNERDNFVISSDSIHQSCTLHRATVHLMLSLDHFSFPPDTTKEWKKNVCPVLRDTAKSPRRPRPSHSYLKISFEK